jgi:hypothetical protein
MVREAHLVPLVRQLQVAHLVHQRPLEQVVHLVRQQPLEQVVRPVFKVIDMPQLQQQHLHWVMQEQ